MPEAVKVLIVFIVYLSLVSYFRKRVPSRSDTYHVFINKIDPFVLLCREKVFSDDNG